MSLSELSDEQLVQLVAQRDPDALAVLYDRHASALYGLILRIVREREVADELLQETMWQVWRKAATYRGGSAGGWIYRIARNRALDQLRRRKARPVAQPTATEQEERGLWLHLAARSDVERDVVRGELRDDVRRALDAIPEEQRLCLELAFFEGLSQSQIAERTNTPLGTTKSRIRGGMRHLARLLRGVGYVLLLLFD